MRRSPPEAGLGGPLSGSQRGAAPASPSTGSTTLPRADTLATGLVGHTLRTYLWHESRIERIEDGAIVLAGVGGDGGARVLLADVQAALDQLAAAGEVQLTFAALGPWATWVAAILVELDGVAYGDAPRRVVLG